MMDSVLHWALSVQDRALADSVTTENLTLDTSFTHVRARVPIIESRFHASQTNVRFRASVRQESVFVHVILPLIGLIDSQDVRHCDLAVMLFTRLAALLRISLLRRGR